jgi:FixJ family two-component response regulator
VVENPRVELACYRRGVAMITGPPDCRWSAPQALLCADVCSLPNQSGCRIVQSSVRSTATVAASPAERPHILCVDDEPNVLASLKVMLAKQYDVHVASSGLGGLEILAALDSISVVISDMRMPSMSGAEFLHQVATRYPTTSRILLTGASDIEAAVDAVNLGNLFRFLLKPCTPEQLRGALEAAVAQHRLLTSERDLLQRTLVGSIRALTEVLGIADPVAFGRINRLKQLAGSVAERMNIDERWPIECAALVCQLGNVSLPEATAKRLYAGSVTSVQERLQVEAAAKLAPGVIKHIPRMEPVVRILEEFASSRPSNHAQLSAGTRILRAVLVYEAFERTSKTQAIAAQAFQAKRGDFDDGVANALLHILGVRAPEMDGSLQVRTDQLRAGMTTAAEIRSPNGMLLVPAGVEISAGLVARLSNYTASSLPPYVAIRPPPPTTET